jgi:transcriptional regulator with XRE-family HTH domain
VSGQQLIEAFCARLKQTVSRSPLTQADLAGRLGLAQASLSAMLNGNRKSPPDWDVVRAIVTACHEAADGPSTDANRQRQLTDDLFNWRRRHSELEDDVDRAASRAAAEQPKAGAEKPEQASPEREECPVCGDAYASEIFSGGGEEYGDELGWQAAAHVLAGERHDLNSQAGTLVTWTVDSGEELTALTDEAADVTFSLLQGLGDRVRQACHGHRVQLLRAAHVILLTEGLMLSEALGMVMRVGRAAEDLDVELLMYGLLSDGSMASAPLPVADVPYQDHRARVSAHYARVLATVPSDGNHGTTTVEEAAEAATSLYESRLAELAAACPELFVWVSMQDGPDAARLLTRVPDGPARARLEGFYRELREQRHGLDGLETLLQALARSTAPSAWPKRLSVLYRRELARPISPIGDTGRDQPGPRLPRLSKGYVNPAFRTAVHEQGANPHMVSWWQNRPLRDDIQSFLAGHITGSPLVDKPLIVLGDPGGGKSLLTRLLAARLPPSDYLPIRIELRNVQADADVLDQVDEALRQTTLSEASWATVTQSIDVLPVLIFDGLDELLQAGGANHGNYLRDIAAFQRTSADNGRPVAAIVTSRTVVADQAQIPESSVIIRLEPFDAERIDRWTDAWNEANSAHFTGQGISPLCRTVTDAHPELAAQPLLLLMLAMYHAVEQTGRFAEKHGPAADRPDSMSRTELYERLLRLFVRREIEKHAPGLPPGDLEEHIENELDLLAVVACGIFNRGRQGVAAEEADHDLGHLRAFDLTLAGLEARRLFGRFFFIHEAKATFGDEDRRWYEFLHSTFGEHLIARKTARTLTRCQDDGRWRALLFAMLSFAPFSDRVQILDNVRELLPSAAVLTRLFRDALQEQPPEKRLDYGVGGDPVPVTRRHAHYSANLLLLALTVADGESVPFSRLVGDCADPVETWRMHATLWKSQFTPDSWDAFTRTVAAAPVPKPGDPGRRDIAVRVGQREHFPTRRTLSWMLDSTEAERRVVYKKDRPGLAALRRARLVYDPDTELALEPVLPVFEELAPLADAVRLPEGGASAAHALVSLLIAEAPPPHSPSPLQARYEMCLDMLGAVPVVHRFVGLVAQRLAQDSEYLPADWVTDVLERLRTAGGGRTDEFDETTRIALATCALRIVVRAEAEVALRALTTAHAFVGPAPAPAHEGVLRHVREGALRQHGVVGDIFSRETGPQPLAEDIWCRLLDLFLADARTGRSRAGSGAGALRTLRVAVALGLRDWCHRHTADVLHVVSDGALAMLTPGELDRLKSALSSVDVRRQLEDRVRITHDAAGRRAGAPPGGGQADVSSSPGRRR